MTQRTEQAAPPETATWQRRHDVDWLRTMALGLLIIYHNMISFQPWAKMFYFIQNREPLEELWIFMGMMNVWRIPILFIISGMGVRFAMERRDWKEFLKDRTIRILLPLVFGYFFICPVHIFIALKAFGVKPAYYPNPGHLWFLVNIYVYVLIFLPLLVYLKNRPGNGLIGLTARIFKRSWGVFILAPLIMVEAGLVNPVQFSGYNQTLHGWLIGAICFLSGFVFVSTGDAFWRSVGRVRWYALAPALGLYLVRLAVFRFQGVPSLLIGLESACWILAILGFGTRYLNSSSTPLTYFSRAVFPVYIIHFPVQYLISYYLLPLELPALLKLALLIIGTFGFCLLIYEYLLKRSGLLRPLFGIKAPWSVAFTKSGRSGSVREGEPLY